MKRLLAIAFYIFFASIVTEAQDNSLPILEREISITATNESIQYILTEISQQAGFVFSYSPNEINAGKKESIDISKKTVRQVLNELFAGTVSYRVKGKYLILKKSDTSKDSKEVVVEGYLYDAQTGEKLTNATVYNPDVMVSAITDEYGYFKLAVPISTIEKELKVSKVGYADTLIIPTSNQSNFVHIEMDSRRSIDDYLALVMPTEESKWEFVFPEWLIADKLLVNSKNVSDTLFRKVQLSAFPFVSTNRFLSGNTINDYSFNMTVGYIQGVRKFEVGGIANIVRQNAGYCQLAGVANVVGEMAYGVQAAGNLNYSKYFTGIQLSGLLNVVMRDASFVQVAGTGNFVGGDFNGVQVAGAINVSSTLEGVQVAGATNLSGDAEGVQVAGIFNHASKIIGTQVSGLINNADSIEGIQVTGFLNRAGWIKGTQVAVINIADTCDGIPVGIINIIRRGYHKLEFSSDEIFYTNIAFRGGVQKFHTMISAGIIPKDFGNPVWTYGFGMGTTFRLTNKLHYDIDLSSQKIMKGNHFSMINSLRRFYMGLDWKIAPKTSLTFGLTYNIYITETDSELYESVYSTLMPYTIADNNYKVNQNIKTWFGGKIGIRFF